MSGAIREPVIFLGDYVQENNVQYGRKGRAYDLHWQCPETEQWIALQTVPVTEAERRERWVSVLTEEGGAIVVPESRLKVVDPFPLYNWSEKYYFRFREEAV